MKKFVSVMLCLSLLLCTQIHASALNSDYISPEEILSIKNADNISSTVKVLNDGQEDKSYVVDTFKVTTATKNTRLFSNPQQIEYSTFIYDLWAPLEDVQGRANDGSVSNSGTDQTYSIMFWIRVNFVDTQHNGKTYRRMTSITGSYDILDSQMSVSSQSVLIAQWGAKTDGTSHNNTLTEYPTTISWDYSLSASDFPAIWAGFADGFQGAHYDYTIKRVTGSTWSGRLSAMSIE